MLGAKEDDGREEDDDERGVILLSRWMGRMV